MQRTSRYRSPYRRYAVVGGLVGIGLTVAAVVFFDISLYLAWIIAMSVTTFAMYGFDKRRAIADGGRVPELVLHGLALAGGFPGGWAGRRAFHHKTRHTSFLVVLICATVIHLVIAWWLFL